VLLKLVMIVGVVLVALPALWLGVQGVGRRTGYRPADPADRASVVVLVVLRVLTLLLVLVLSAVVLVSAIGALLRGIELMPVLVLVFFVLDLLLAALVLLTFGRRDPRPARRRATPARR
jgi:hypothetical protein